MLLLPGLLASRRVKRTAAVAVAAVAAVVVVELITVFLVRNSGLPVLNNPPPHPADYSNTKELGAVLYTEHVYAFELASFVLLLAIVAARVAVPPTCDVCCCPSSWQRGLGASEESCRA